MIPPPPRSAFFPYTTLFRSNLRVSIQAAKARGEPLDHVLFSGLPGLRSEEHTSELQSLTKLVCRLLLEKKKTTTRADRAARRPDQIVSGVDTQQSAHRALAG